MSTNSAVIIPTAPMATNAAATNSIAGNELHDIKGPVYIPSAWAWLWWTLAILAVALACVALRYWLKKRPKAKASPILVAPHVRALQNLRDALALIRQPRPFCIVVSDTLRVYLEERFHLRAPERTTEEFLAELQSSPLLSPGQKQSLGDFLMRCDLVKFARYEPGEQELRDLYEAAVRLVDETIPAPPAASTGEVALPPQSPATAIPPKPQPAISGKAERVNR